MDSSMPNRRPIRLYSRKTDWDIFQKALDQSIREIPELERQEVQVEYSSFIAIVEDAMSVAIPERNRRRGILRLHDKNRPCPW